MKANVGTENEIRESSEKGNLMKFRFRQAQISQPKRFFIIQGCRRAGSHYFEDNENDNRRAEYDNKTNNTFFVRLQPTTDQTTLLTFGQITSENSTLQ